MQPQRPSVPPFFSAQQQPRQQPPTQPAAAAPPPRNAAAPIASQRTGAPFQHAPASQAFGRPSQPQQPRVYAGGSSAGPAKPQQQQQRHYSQATSSTLALTHTKTEMGLDDFDEYQRAAIAAPLDGAHLITAGPGSGKTRTIIGRVMYMVKEHQIKGGDILMVTFSKEATTEVTQRLARQAAACRLPELQRITVKTFHALCLRIIHTYVSELRGHVQQGFQLVTPREQREIVKEAIADLNRESEGAQASREFDAHMQQQDGGSGIRRMARQSQLQRSRQQQQIDVQDADKVLKWISKQKALGVTPAELANGGQTSPYQKLYQRYADALVERNRIDFNDMIGLASDLLERNSNVAQEVAARWQYVLVDEFQDLSRTQFRLLMLIAPHRRITIVGDANQSIYGFRGGDVSLFNEFRVACQSGNGSGGGSGASSSAAAAGFATIREHELGVNYRSTKHIVDAAAHFISSRQGSSVGTAAQSRQDTKNAQGRPIVIGEFKSEDEEVAWVVSDIQRRRREGIPYKEMAVLCRVHKPLKKFEDALKKAGVPYCRSTKRALADRVSISHVLAYLELALDPDDNTAFLKIMNVPKRNMTDRVVAFLKEVMEYKPARRGRAASASAAADDAPTTTSFIKAIDKIPGKKFKGGTTSIGDKQRDTLRGIAALVKELGEEASRSSPARVIELLLDKVSLKKYFDGEQQRISNAIFMS